MRWIWIDRILELDAGQRCVAVKNVSLAEEVLHDHFPARPERGEPAQPVMPASLIIEGMAQTAGILLGHAHDFRHNVILAKVSKARFTAVARPGDQLRFEAALQRHDATGGSSKGLVWRIDPADGERSALAEIDLMFSHVHGQSGPVPFPEHNFVFTEQFMNLLEQSGFPIPKPGE